MVHKQSAPHVPRKTTSDPAESNEAASRRRVPAKKNSGEQMSRQNSHVTGTSQEAPTKVAKKRKNILAKAFNAGLGVCINNQTMGRKSTSRRNDTAARQLMLAIIF